MSNKFLSIPKVIFLTLFLTFLFYSVLAAPYWAAVFKYQSLSGSGIGYTLLGRQDDLEEGVEETVIKPVSKKFGLVIPSLGVNKSIRSEVDLTDGEGLGYLLDNDLAHVKGSPLPNRRGTMVLFGHSPLTFLNFKYHHPDFYLIGKLVEGDLIYVVHEEVEYAYRVSAISTQAPDYFDFFDSARERKLILVSGWPPGTALRLKVVEATAIE